MENTENTLEFYGYRVDTGPRRVTCGECLPDRPWFQSLTKAGRNVKFFEVPQDGPCDFCGIERMSQEKECWEAWETWDKWHGECEAGILTLCCGGWWCTNPQCESAIAEHLKSHQQ